MNIYIYNYIYNGITNCWIIIIIRARYSRMMEEGFFRNKPADYLWLLLFSATTLIVCSVKHHHRFYYQKKREGKNRRKED